MTGWDVVTILLFTCHLLAVNLAVGGPLVASLLAWYAVGKGEAWADEAGRRLAWQGWWALLAGGALGFVVLGLWWLREPQVYRDGFWHVPRSRLVFGVVEWGFSLVLGWIYAAGWAWFGRRRTWHALVCLVSVTNLAYHFPTLFAAVNELNVEPALRAVPYDHLALVARPGALAGMVHHLLAAPAVAGSALLMWGIALERRGAAYQEVRAVAAWGARVALLCSLLQVPVGLWFLVSLPVSARDALLGGNLLSTCLLGAGVVLAVALLQQWAGIAWGEVDAGLLRRSVAMLVLVVLLMVAARHVSRERMWDARGRFALQGAMR